MPGGKVDLSRGLNWGVLGEEQGGVQAGGGDKAGG